MALGLPVLGYIASTPHITEHNFLLILWLSWAFASVALIFRLYLRATIFGRIQSDDFLAILAWILFLANNILWCTQVGMVYMLMDITSPAMPTDLFQVGMLAKKFIKMLLVFNSLYHASLWAVKLSFLMFFRNLIKKNVTWKIWWYVVSLLTVGAWAVTVGEAQHKCASYGMEYILEHCTTTDSARIEARVLLIAACMDVATNLLIMTFPVMILHKSETGLKQKLCLLGLLQVVLISMALALAKALVTFRSGFVTDVTWNLSLGHIKMALAMIAVCLGSFQQLYTNKKLDSKGRSKARVRNRSGTKNTRRQYPGDTGLRRFLPFLSRRWSITSSTKSFHIQYTEPDNGPEMDAATEKDFNDDSASDNGKRSKAPATENITQTDSGSPVTSVHLTEALLSGYTSTPAFPRPILTKSRATDSSRPTTRESSIWDPITSGLRSSSRCGTWFRSRSNSPGALMSPQDRGSRTTLMSRFARPSRHYKPTLEINAGDNVVRDWRWQFADRVERQGDVSPVLSRNS